jgi:cyclopropane fatty-acyl-phospholipid synthase-like methyltransferase
MSQMTLADFEARYRADPDPWSYTSSRYEQAKYDATLGACGPGPFRCALELGSSIGVFSARLAPRCQSLVTIDAAPTAVAEARRRLAGLPEPSGVSAIAGSIPEAIPRCRYDLIVASEILYYLDEQRLRRMLDRLRQLCLPRARWVAVHWRPDGPERALAARDAHDLLHAQDWLLPVTDAHTDDYLLDVLERR